MLATADCEPGTLFDLPGGGPMFDDVVVGLWEGLTAHRSVQCPVCGGQMRPEYGAQALPVRGRCTECGTTLSWPPGGTE
jgi:hypothetical protein